jgi:hypothetical protein
VATRTIEVAVMKHSRSHERAVAIDNERRPRQRR